MNFRAMNSRRRLGTAALAVGILAGGPALTGCEAVERETGISRQGQMGAGAGAAAGGVLAALAGANPGWIAASVLLGGAAGGAIAEYLNREDLERHASSQYTALDSLGEGQSRSWNNPTSGNRGRTTVTDVFQNAQGQTCKTFTETIYSNQGTLEEGGTACEGPDGWQVQSA